MNFSGLSALNQLSAGSTRLLSEDELQAIIKLLDTLPPGATLQSVLTTNTTHPVVPILLALNPNQLQQIQQYMAARMRQLSQQFLQPQLLQQVQTQQNVQPQRIVTIQPRQSVLVPPKSNMRPNADIEDWVCPENNCRALNIGWRAACSECGVARQGMPVDNFSPRAMEQYNGQMVNNNNGFGEPNYNHQPYQQEHQFHSGQDLPQQERMSAYNNMQPSDDYPLEPLGVDVDAPVDDDPNDMEIETFDNATSSILSVKKVIESPIKQRPPSRVVNARASALIPPSMPMQNQASYYREPSPPPLAPEQHVQSNSYYDENQYNSPIDRPPISPVLADQEQSDGYDYNNAVHEDSQGHHQDDHKKYRKRDKDEPLVMSDRTIYVKNIVTVDEEELEKIFRAAGSIRDIRMKRSSNSPTRSAFIEYWNKEDAQVAYDTLHGVSLAGKRLQVGWAVARFSGKPLSKPSKSLFLGNLPSELTESMIRQIVAPYGTVLGVKKVYQFGDFKGCAFVDFMRVEDAQKALYAVHRTVHKGKRIRADFSHSAQESSDYIPGLDIGQDGDPRPARDSNKDPRDDHRSHKDDYGSRHRNDNKPISTELREKTTFDQTKNVYSTPIKANEKSLSTLPTSALKNAEQNKTKPLMVVVSPPKPKKYWKPTRNLEHYIEAIRVSKSSAGLMSTVIEKRGVSYKSLNSKGDFTDIKLYLEGPKRKVDEFFNFVASCRAGTIDKDVVYPVFIVSRGHADIAHLNWESPYVLGPRSENVSFSGVSFKKGSANYPIVGKQAMNPVVTVVVDPNEAELYRKSVPNVLLLILPENNKPLSYARHAVKRMAEGADCDGTLIELPFFWLCDDNLVQFSKLEYETGQKQKQRKTGDEMFKEAFLHAQAREDINDYGLIGFLRYDDTAVSRSVDEAKNKSSLYKCVLVNVNKTRGTNYIPGLKKFEEVALAMRLKRDSVPTLKLFNYCYRALTLQQDYNVAKERSDYTEVEELRDTSIDVDELLEEGYEPRTAAEIEDISALKEWIVKQENKGKLIVRPRPSKPVPRLEPSKSGTNNVTPVDSPVKFNRRQNKAAQKSASEASSARHQTSEVKDADDAIVDNDGHFQEDDKEESSVIGKELIFPDVDPAEIAAPVKKRPIINEDSSSSGSSSDSSSSDSEDSVEQPGTTRIKSKNEQQNKRQADVKEAINNQATTEVVTSISEAAKLREKRPSAVAAVQAITTPPKKKTPLKGAAVKAPAPPKEKKAAKAQESTAQGSEEKPAANKRGRKRKADEVSQSESDASGVNEPVKKKSRAKPVGPDGRRHYCHQCRQPRVYEDVIYCSKSTDGGCKNNRGWCSCCLKNRYGLNMEELRDKEWTCPMCLGHCNCSTCRVLSGKKPTGALTIDTVRSLGFESVHHYLVSTDDEKVVTAIKEAASKKKAEKKAKTAPTASNNDKNTVPNPMEIAADAENSTNNAESTSNNNNNTSDDVKSRAEENKVEASEQQVTEDTAREKRVQPTRTTPAKRGRKKAPAHPIERDIEPIVIDDEGEEYVVDQIYLKRKNVNTQLVQFLVKWHGFPLTLCTWVNLADMFCGDMLNDFELAWSARREKIEAAAKKKPKLKEITVEAHESTDIGAETQNNTNVLVPSQGEDKDSAALNKSMQLTQTQDEIPLGTSQASLVPQANNQTSISTVNVSAITKQPVSSASTDQVSISGLSVAEQEAQPVEQSGQVGNQAEFIQNVISTTNLSPEEALMLSEIANQVINEAIGQVSVDSMIIDSQAVLPDSAVQAQEQSMETEAQQHIPADQARAVVESNVTEDVNQMDIEPAAVHNASESALQSTEQHTVVNQAQSAADYSAMQTDVTAVQESAPTSSLTEAPLPMDTSAQLSTTTVTEQTDSTTSNNTVPVTEAATYQQPAETEAQQHSAVEQMHTAVESKQQEGTNITAVENISTGAEHVFNVNNIAVPVPTESSAVEAEGAITAPKEVNSSPATSPSQLKYSMAELSRARSERIKKSQSEVSAPVSSEVVTPTKESSEPKEEPPNVTEPTSPMASNVAPVKPNSQKQSAKKPTPVKEASNIEVTPVKLDANDVTGETDPNEFDVGMKVWVKLTGYKWWPGQIVAKMSDDSFLVIFYSAESFKEVSLSDPDTKMVLFEGYLDILGPVTSKKALNDAVAQQHDWHVYSEDLKKKKPTKRRKKKW